MSAQVTILAMTSKGHRVLRAIATRHPDVVGGVVGARDREIRDDHYEQIRSLCTEVGWSFADRTDRPAIRTAYALTISWRWMVDPTSSRLIALHDSILPRYRGFSPLVTALVNGDDELGVTAIFASDEYDAGPIIGQVVRPIEYPIRIADAIDRVSSAYEELAVSIVQRLAHGEALQAHEQDESRATYSLWRDGEDYGIDWSQSSARIRRFIDAVGQPYAGASSSVDGIPARVLDACEEGDVVIENRVPGKVLFVRGGEPIVVCGSGLLRVRALINEQTGETMLPLAKFRTRFV